MQRLTIAADGRPLELLRSVYRPDYFQFAIRLTRPRGQADATL
jgi:GntR family transcriptional regulator